MQAETLGYHPTKTPQKCFACPRHRPHHSCRMTCMTGVPIWSDHEGLLNMERSLPEYRSANAANTNFGRMCNGRRLTFFIYERSLPPALLDPIHRDKARQALTSSSVSAAANFDP